MKSIIGKLLFIIFCFGIFSSCATLPEESKLVEFSRFAPIIYAYAQFEQSGFEVYDKDLIEGSDFASYKYEQGKANIIFSYYDINNDGIMELLIGVRVIIGQSNELAYNSIHVIYTLQDNSPAYVIKKTSHKSVINLLIDNKENNVIEYSHGQMDHAEDFFYTIDENGELVILDKLYTKGIDKTKENWRESISHFRAKEVDGERIDISEEEYSFIIQKYGASGYANKYKSKLRAIKIDWKPIA